MHDWQAALRLAIVFAVAAFIALAASVYEIDRREKSSADTIAANFADLVQQPKPSVIKFVFSTMNMQDASQRISDNSRRLPVELRR